MPSNRHIVLFADVLRACMYATDYQDLAFARSEQTDFCASTHRMLS
tara:strand:+ start:1805 stop:1942 length:138 start_codon:yes stop_codon:yes gene_type:complete